MGLGLGGLPLSPCFPLSSNPSSWGGLLGYPMFAVLLRCLIGMVGGQGLQMPIRSAGGDRLGVGWNSQSEIGVGWGLGRREPVFPRDRVPLGLPIGRGCVARKVGWPTTVLPAGGAPRQLQRQSLGRTAGDGRAAGSALE